MKNNFIKTYYFRFILDLLFSTLLFFISTFFFIYNFSIFENKNFYFTNFSDYFLNIDILTLILCFFLGVIVFAITFLFLEIKRVSYIDEILKKIENIANDRLTNNIIVDTFDDLSDASSNLNIIQNKIVDLVEKEANSENTKNELITNVAHDLRTPLTSIIGYIDILKNNNKLSSEKKDEFLKIAYEKSLKLENLIEDLFSYTKLNYGKLNAEFSKIDIVKLINQLTSEMYPLFINNNLNYQVETNVNELYLSIDPKLIARLFENLINNAIKYGKDGKNIIIRINKYNEKNVRISIINFGEIIPSESLNRLFDRFYRTDSSRTSEISGSGLGLAIVKNIAEIHNTTINVKSDKNGTEFYVEFKI